MEPGVQTAGRSKNFASILIGFQATRLTYGAACKSIAADAHRICYSPMRFIGLIAGVARFPR
jgi:hypothetical protein